MQIPPPKTFGNQAPKPRIVQYRNKRYSVRLEPIYWQTLEVLAERQRLRLGRFVAELAERYDGPNFSSYLRVFCMLEGEQALARETLGPTHHGLLDVVTNCPNPGLILSRYRTVIAYNSAFGEWLGPADVAVIGAELTTLVQIRTRRSLSEVWQDLVNGREAKSEAKLLYVAPGRVNAAQATILALRSQTYQEFYAVMWLSLQAKRPSLSGNLPVPPSRASLDE
ncbi:ribbon-helix-helix domain-containing protein [Pelagibius litoralis]|uniref:Ribbon-helix-helix domain-containing protein n=1 Tax=Pelagibius litoralis TaxID=374515 RepID=A0A967F2W6_9PROT|nr:ribbon-helix-helix domain-containing protein [Pelagibius litoralis]NIA72017.1 ribbon-helix-helix domain-containing protein [Pelagibius litoralis]